MDEINFKYKKANLPLTYKKSNSSLNSEEENNHLIYPNDNMNNKISDDFNENVANVYEENFNNTYTEDNNNVGHIINENDENNLKNLFVIEQLVLAYNQFEDNNNKKEIIKGILQPLSPENIESVFDLLIIRNLQDIIIYLIDKYKFLNKKNFEDLLIKACHFEQIDVIVKIKEESDADLIRARDMDGNTCLIISAIKSNLKMAKIFLTSPELLDTKNKYGIDAITISIYNNDNLMFFLLANNLNTNLQNLSYLSKIAIRMENYEILEFLLKKLKDDKTLLHYACNQKNLRIFNLVLSHSSDIEYKDSNGETPLHWASIKGSYAIMELLLKKYKSLQKTPDPKNNFGVTPFHLTVLKQDKMKAKLLFDYGSNANEVDNKGNTVVHYAVQCGDLKWLKYISKTFNLNCFLKNNLGNTPFINACLNNCIEIVKYFLGSLPNINWKNKMGQTALHAAVFNGNSKIVEMLLLNKADIRIKDINDLTPYHYAVIDKKPDLIKVMHSVLKINDDNDNEEVDI